MAAALAASVSVRFGLNEDYFGLFTVALSQILKILFVNWTFAGKAMGIGISTREWNLLQMSFPEKTPYLFVALGLLAAVLVLSYLIQRNRLGLYFAAVRESPMAAEALGVNVTRYRIMAIGISGAVAGCAGSFYSQLTSYIDPDKVFGLTLNFDFLLGPVLGGSLSLAGPVLGALILRPVKDILRGWLGGGADALYLVLLGAVLIIGILLMPRGITGYLQKLHARFLAAR
jgi:branched-chain amino acid transport system permease protein